jgi:hypothetical protein
MAHPSFPDATVKAMAARVLKAFRSWHTDQRHASELSVLRRFQHHVKLGESPGRATDQLLRSALQELKGYAPEQADILKMRFENGWSMTRVGQHFDWGQSTLFKQQKAAIDEIAKILLRHDAEPEPNRQGLLLEELPLLSTAPLVGIEAKLQVVQTPLQHPAAPWLVGIWGMGGIGKTSLADALARRLLLEGHIDRVEQLMGGGTRKTILGAPHLDLSTLKDLLVAKVLHRNRAAWTIPDFEQMDALFAGMREHAFLVVLDNLETVPNVMQLLPFLRTLANPTKIVLTSRVRLQDEDDIFEYPLPPLTLQECHALLVQEGHIRHIPSLQELDEGSSRRIYEVVGGNPLAIRLVAGQLRVYPIEEVLGDLKGLTGVGESLYQFLFEWLWDALTEPCRQVLVALVLAPPEGVSLAVLSRLARMDTPPLKAALHPLLRQNLVDVRNETTEPIFSIHNLTRTFLHNTTAKG